MAVIGHCKACKRLLDLPTFCSLLASYCNSKKYSLSHPMHDSRLKQPVTFPFATRVAFEHLMYPLDHNSDVARATLGQPRHREPSMHVEDHLMDWWI